MQWLQQNTYSFFLSLKKIWRIINLYTDTYTDRKITRGMRIHRFLISVMRAINRKYKNLIDVNDVNYIRIYRLDKLPRSGSSTIIVDDINFMVLLITCTDTRMLGYNRFLCIYVYYSIRICNGLLVSALRRETTIYRYSTIGDRCTMYITGLWVITNIKINIQARILEASELSQRNFLKDLEYS